MSAVELSLKTHCQAHYPIDSPIDSKLLYQHLHIKITAADGIITPADLKGLLLPAGMIWSQGVVLEGRAPIWLYSYLTHACHPAAWLGCFDPRMGTGEAQTGGAVVVMSHIKTVKVGEVIAVRMPDEYFE